MAQLAKETDNERNHSNSFSPSFFFPYFHNFRSKLPLVITWKDYRLSILNYYIDYIAIGYVTNSYLTDIATSLT